MARQRVVTDLSTPGTLPDLLRPGLALVFVGINPSLYSVQQGHYFARRTNRFWPALSRSRLSRPIREGLGVAVLEPEHDAALLDYSFGFTDVVKRATNNAGQLAAAEFVHGARLLQDRLAAVAPQVVCFQGVTGYRPFARHALGVDRQGLTLGEQPERVAGARVFVAPSPSPANAHFSLADQVGWYDALADFLAERAAHSRLLDTGDAPYRRL